MKDEVKFFMEKTEFIVQFVYSLLLGSISRAESQDSTIESS